ncbi:MAG: hypothetical protein MJZ53_01705 [Paludibacteraceae bacterium]|nr:hypothetical protein [Paludibacteraceae bacterium]
MARTSYDQPTGALHGKTKKESKGYHYVTKDGRTHYRERDESYQKNLSPRQIWNSQAFAYAHAQVPQYFATEEATAATVAAWKEAKRGNTKAKMYADAHRWKFADLQDEWKSEHPFEQWLEEHLNQISAMVAAKTSSEKVSNFMVRSQIAELQSRIRDLEALLKD